MQTYEERKLKITEAAREILALEHVTDITTLQVYLCNDAGLPADFAEVCPDVDESPRKLAWVQATEAVPVYFLRLFGVESINMTTSAVGEAATVDLVLVFDTSESMGKDTPGDMTQTISIPSACNWANDCQPLYAGQDCGQKPGEQPVPGVRPGCHRHFRLQCRDRFRALGPDLGDDDFDYDGDVYDAIDHYVILHDDAPSAKLDWYASWKYQGFDHPMNLIYPDDRDGDGAGCRSHAALHGCRS